MDCLVRVWQFSWSDVHKSTQVESLTWKRVSRSSKPVHALAFMEGWQSGWLCLFAKQECLMGIVSSNLTPSDLYKTYKQMRQCVRCWLHLDKDQKLWCKKCRERVDEELRWEISRPFEYYFKRNLKHKK